uniref:Uncharacterized protein n=1 Tax=viral metagenome TaxID=1070528 RepID=A0A6C0AXY5_9ZZZZ|tara:strand:+ start:1208 stop:1585 length:378 start_codon:yes stop_codon:yes gene_type:complete
MNNITYSIVECSESSNEDNTLWEDIKLTNNCNIDQNNNLNISDEWSAREIDYELNYTVKYLSSILDFYDIKKHKLNKKDIITRILEFEMDKENFSIVEQRKRLFENFIELKNDKYFSKFILGSIG